MASQRSRMTDATRPVKRARKLGEEHYENCFVFQQIIETDDLAVLAEGHQAHIIREPATLRWTLEQKLKQDPTALKQFIDGLTERLELESFFRTSLLPSQSGDDDESEIGLHPQESLLRVLLGVPSLQTKMISLLLEKIPEFMEMADDSSIRTDIPRLILHQLRWLDTVFDEQGLADCLLETMEVCPEGLQKEIVSAVPEIVTDSTHEVVVSRLHDLMTDNISMTTSVLDALSNLTLEPALSANVSERVLQLMDVTSVDDLPVVIRFLLKNSSRDNVDKICENIMKSLRFIGQGLSNGKGDQQSLVFVIEALMHGIRFYKPMARSMLKILAKSKVEAPIHCWILLMLVSTELHKKKAEAIFKKRVLEDSLPISLVKRSVTSHNELVAMLSKSAICIADIFVQSPQPKLQKAGSSLYQCIFEMHEDIFTRQNVIGNIVCHVGSGMKSEIDTALHLLLSLVRSNCDVVRSFFPFVKGLLDYVDALSNAQLRVMFVAFYTLETLPGSNGDEVDIVVQKLLHDSNYNTKCIGIIGAISMLHARHNSNANVPESIRHFVRMLLTNATSHISAFSFFCDEVIHCIRHSTISGPVLGLFYEFLIEKFQSLFRSLCHDDDDEPEAEHFINSDLGEENWWNLDGDESPVALGITSALLSPDRLKLRGYLGALPQMAEFIVSSGVEEDPDGDAVLLGCPLAMFRIKVLENLDELDVDMTAIVLSSLFHAMNWLRSVINCFVDGHQCHKFRAWKLSRRLHHILLLEHHIGKAASLEFVPLGITDQQAQVLHTFKSPKNDDVMSPALRRLSTISRRFWARAYTMFTWPLRLSLSESDEEIGSFSTENCPEAYLYVDTFAFLLREFVQDLLAVFSNQPLRFGSKTVAPSPNDASTSPVVFLRSLGYNAETQTIRDSEISGNESSRTFRSLGRHILAISKILNGENRLEQPFDGAMETLWTCFEECLDVLHRLIHSNFFSNVDEEDLLTSVLCDFCGFDATEETSLPQARKYVFEFLARLQPASFSRIDLAVRSVSLMKDLVGISACSDEHNLKTKLSALADQLLNSDWHGNAKLNAANVGTLVEVYVEYAQDPLKVVDDLIVNSFQCCFDDGDTHTFASTLTKKSFVFWYRACINQVNLMIETLQEPLFHDFVQGLRYRASVFNKLTTIAASPAAPKSVLAAIVAGGRVFIDNMLKHFNLLNSKFNTQSTLILETITETQSSTKMLQRICLHAKRQKASTVLSRIPLLKKSLEVFLLRSKTLFAANDIDIRSGRVKLTTIDGKRYSSSDEEEEEHRPEEQEQEQEPDLVEGNNDEV